MKQRVLVLKEEGDDLRHQSRRSMLDMASKRRRRKMKRRRMACWHEDNDWTSMMSCLVLSIIQWYDVRCSSSSSFFEKWIDDPC